jgi:hypothetical protein
MHPMLIASALLRRQFALAAALALAVAAAVTLLFAVKPSELWFLPACQFHRLTGLHCPGCGMTRASWHLLHGRVFAALHCNALFTLALPVIAGVGLWRWWRPQSASAWKPAYTWLMVGVLIVFGVLRNVPAYPFTLLAP